MKRGQNFANLTVSRATRCLQAVEVCANSSKHEALHSVYAVKGYMTHGTTHFIFGTRHTGKKEQALRAASSLLRRPGLHLVVMCATDEQARRAACTAKACGVDDAAIQCTAVSSIRHVQAQMYRCRALCTTPPKWQSLLHSGTLCADHLTCLILVHVEDIVALHRRHLSALCRLARAPTLQQCYVTTSSVAAPSHVAALRRTAADACEARDVPQLTRAAAGISHACLAATHAGAVTRGLHQRQPADDGLPLLIARGYRAAQAARDELASLGCSAYLMLSDAGSGESQHHGTYCISTPACARSLPRTPWTSVWLLCDNPTTECWLAASCLAPGRPVYSSAVAQDVRDELAACGIHIATDATDSPA